MPYDFNKFKTLLDKAGISVAEAAQLFRTTRPTIYHWLKGNVPSQGIVREYAERVVGILERAVTAGDLPLSDSSREERRDLLKEAIKRNMAPRSTG